MIDGKNIYCLKSVQKSLYDYLQIIQAFLYFSISLLHFGHTEKSAERKAMHFHPPKSFVKPYCYYKKYQTTRVKKTFLCPQT